MKYLKKYFLIGLVLGCILILGVSASAEGITISPAFQEITLTNNLDTETGSFSITNSSDSPQSYVLKAIDIETANDSGGVLLSGLTAEFQTKYGLIEWLSFDKDQITVAPNETANVDFTIKNSDKLTPGGHYGALVAQPQVQFDPDAANKVTVMPQAAALIFVKKIGGEKYRLELDKPSQKLAAMSLPSELNLLFKNEGDVHVVPRGTVVINDSFGREVSRGAINSDSVLILPSKSRKMPVELRGVLGGIRWPGRYQLSIEYRFEGSDQIQNVETNVWFINLPLVGMGLILVVLLAGLIKYFGMRIIRWLFGLLKRLPGRKKRPQN